MDLRWVDDSGMTAHAVAELSAEVSDRPVHRTGVTEFYRARTDTKMTIAAEGPARSAHPAAGMTTVSTSNGSGPTHQVRRPSTPTGCVNSIKSAAIRDLHRRCRRSQPTLP